MSVLLLLQRDWSQGGINSVRALYYSTASQLGLTPSEHNVPSLVVRPAAAAACMGLAGGAAYARLSALVRNGELVQNGFGVVSSRHSSNT